MTTGEITDQAALLARRARGPVEWTDAELAQYVADRYVPAEAPPCRVCGAALSIVSWGGGPTLWGCVGMEPDPADPECSRWTKGRALGDEHLSESQWEDRRRGGDVGVMELLRRHDELAAEVRRLTVLIAGESERALAEDVAHDVVWYGLLHHPLPWRVERDWTYEVTARDGAVIAKCMTHDRAAAVIATAEQIMADLTVDESTEDDQ